MCGIFGVVGNSTVREIALDGMLEIKHRAADAASFFEYEYDRRDVRVDGTIKDLLQVVRQSEPLNMAVAWGRYRTTGSLSLENAQPFVNDNETISLFENGQVKNQSSLTHRLLNQGFTIRSSSDAEVLLHVFSAAYSVTRENTIERFFRAAHETQLEAVGGYSCVVMIRGQGMGAFKDPHGIRPMP